MESPYIHRASTNKTKSLFSLELYIQTKYHRFDLLSQLFSHFHQYYATKCIVIMFSLHSFVDDYVTVRNRYIIYIIYRERMCVIKCKENFIIITFLPLSSSLYRFNVFIGIKEYDKCIYMELEGMKLIMQMPLNICTGICTRCTQTL